ncbi:MAG: hypothetical protein HKN03_02425 [Acidimicrobiales bacterium]|nr:hypothetical protein [Acidimicrobiales bacterium]
MPHITIEHSANLNAECDVQALVDAVHAAALAHELPPVAGLRTRAQSREHYRIADGDPRYGFVAITARIGPGRDAATKDTFLARLLDTTEDFLAVNAPNLIVALSGEVQEIDHPHRVNRNQIRAHLETKEDL